MSVSRAVVVILACTTLASALAAVTVSMTVHADVARLEAKLTASTGQAAADLNQTDSRLDQLSLRLTELTDGTRKQITAARWSTRSDMARIGSGLTGKLDEMTRQMDDLALSSRQQADAGVVARTAPNEAPSVAPPPPIAEQDLAAIRQSEHGTALFDSGNYAEAQRAFLQILATRPDDLNARLY